MPLERLGPYRIERQIGRGGMGSVYAAVHLETQECVAIKVLSPLLAADEPFRQRFAAEIESLILLRHPNIVKIFAYGEEEGNLFYAMELVQGRSLFDEQQTGRRFTWQEVARFGIDVCKALKHAHDSGIVHRDLKPANLLLDTEGNIKLTDFGIAKLFGGTNLTSDGGVLGTADYMAPEQAEGKPTTTRTDLYSLGGVLFALLAARPPFVARSLPEVLHMLRYSEPTPIRRLVPDVPEEFELIINELLEKDPQHRVPTARVLGRRLEAMLRALSAPPKAKDAPTQTGGPLTHGGKLPGKVPSLPDNPTRIAGTPPADDAAATRASTDLTLNFGDEEFRLQDSPATAQGMPRTNPGGSHLTAGMTQRAGDFQPERGEDSPRQRAQFTVVDDKERRRAGQLQSEDESSPLWIRIAGLAVVLSATVALLLFAFSAPSANRLYERLHALASEDDASKLLLAETDIDKFLELYPADERAAEIKGYQQELELYRMQQQFNRRMRRAGGGEKLSAIEQAYLEALHDVAADPELGLTKMQAVVAVFDNGPPASEQNQRCVELARRQIARLNETLAASQTARLAELRLRLSTADQLATTAPQSATAIYQGLIDLYATKPWAADLVMSARAKLASLRPK